MDDFREALPTITGPGAFFVFLVFIALLLTSDTTRVFAKNGNFLIGLVAISIPLSVFITQIYHAMFTAFCYRIHRKWTEKYTKNREHHIDKFVLTVDYVSHKNGKWEKEWRVIQKIASAFHFSNTLLLASIGFLVTYAASWHWNILHRNPTITTNPRGVSTMWIIALSCIFLFSLASVIYYERWMFLHEMLLKDMKKNKNENPESYFVAFQKKDFGESAWQKIMAILCFGILKMPKLYKSIFCVSPLRNLLQRCTKMKDSKHGD